MSGHSTHVLTCIEGDKASMKYIESFLESNIFHMFNYPVGYISGKKKKKHVLLL